MAATDFSLVQHEVIWPGAGLGNGPPVISQTDTNQNYILGLSVQADDMNTLGTRYRGAAEYVYCRGSNVTARGQFVQIVSNSALLLDSANNQITNATCYYGFPVGLAAGALSATNVYGWVQVAGIADYATCSNTDFGPNLRVCLGSTAGQVGSVTALGSRIHGINVISSYANARSASAPNMTVQLNHPFVIGITDSN